MRKPFIIANWKMNKNVDEALNFLDDILGALPDSEKEDVGIAPQAFAIYPMMQLTRTIPLQIIGQNAAAKCNGAYTGEISVRDLAAMGVNYVMLGHAERRSIFKESNQIINQKILTALREGVSPIVCTNGDQKTVTKLGHCYDVFSQLDHVLSGVPVEQVHKIIFRLNQPLQLGRGITQTWKRLNTGVYFCGKKFSASMDQKLRSRYEFYMAGVSIRRMSV